MGGVVKGIKKVVKSVTKVVKKVVKTVAKVAKKVVKGVGGALKKLGPIASVAMMMIPGAQAFAGTLWANMGVTSAVAQNFMTGAVTGFIGSGGKLKGALLGGVMAGAGTAISRGFQGQGFGSGFQANTGAWKPSGTGISGAWDAGKATFTEKLGNVFSNNSATESISEGASNFSKGSSSHYMDAQPQTTASALDTQPISLGLEPTQGTLGQGTSGISQDWGKYAQAPSALSPISPGESFQNSLSSIGVKGTTDASGYWSATPDTQSLLSPKNPSAFDDKITLGSPEPIGKLGEGIKAIDHLRKPSSGSDWKKAGKNLFDALSSKAGKNLFDALSSPTSEDDGSLGTIEDPGHDPQKGTITAVEMKPGEGIWGEDFADFMAGYVRATGQSQRASGLHMAKSFA